MANQTPTATLSEDKLVIYLRLPYGMASIGGHIRGASWDPYEKTWVVPNTEDAVEVVKSIAGIRLPAELIDSLDTGINWSEIGVTPIAPMPLKEGIVPFAHQIAGYNQALEHFDKGGTGFALFMEQGCGKTLTAIAIDGRLVVEGKAKRTLVVAPVSVLPVWQTEFKSFLQYSTNTETLTGTKAQKLRALNRLGNEGVAIINYESIWRDGIDEAITAWEPDIIICDESQRIKSPRAQQSKFLHNLGAFARYKLCLSGTPVMNAPIDLWSQYQFMQRGIFDSNYWAFRTRHAIMGGYENKQIIAYRGVKDLKAKAHSVAIRVTKASALDLPEETSQKLYCELEPKARRVYNQVKSDFAAEFGNGGMVTGDKIITRLLRFSQITGGFVTVSDEEENTSIEHVSDAKLKLLDETLGDLLETPTKKVVIFARFRAEIGAIKKICEEHVGKDGVRLFWGDTKQGDRGQYVEDFQKDPDVRIFIAQNQTGGVGITLTAADTMIFYSLDYSYGNHAQAMARIHRISQKYPVTYMYLLARETIDELVFETLQNKKSMAESIMDNIGDIINVTPDERDTERRHARYDRLMGEAVGDCVKLIGGGI